MATEPRSLSMISQPRRSRALIAVCALAASVIVASALASAPANRAKTVVSNEGLSFSAQIERNVAVLKRSRTWWEHYGQHHAKLRPVEAE
jgi:hypothetical protein